jgi:transposase-like protein
VVGSARGVEETLTYYAFPEEHWRRIRTTDEIDKRFRCGRGILQ